MLGLLGRRCIFLCLGTDFGVNYGVCGGGTLRGGGGLFLWCKGGSGLGNGVRSLCNRWLSSEWKIVS